MPSFSQSDEQLVPMAVGGDRDALNELIRRHQSWVFNLALRMIWRREAAEDATQEILVKAVTKLASFEGRSTFRTWLNRVAVNHLLNVRKSEMEEKAMTFSDMGLSLDAVGDQELADLRTLPVEKKVIVEEARLGCITAMLMCLDRRQRIAFILGEILGEASDAAAGAMGVTSANFRQLLSRARRDLYQFMNEKCGLVNTSNPCRCARKASGFMRNGWLDPHSLSFSKDRIEAVRRCADEKMEELNAIDRQHAEIYRQQPFLAGPDLSGKLRELIMQSGFSAE